MIPFLLVAAVVYWLAAPDPVTAGLRTASGTGARAAGAGARQHWSGGREQRQGRRTARRERWDGRVKGAKPHPWLLRGDRAITWAWGTGKTLAGITGAALKPVPAAVSTGWELGRERHRNRAGNSSAKGAPWGLVVDPPWWRRDQVQPAEQASGTGQEQAPEQVEDSPQEQPLDTEEQIRARRTPAWDRAFPEPMTESERRFWTARDGGYGGPLDQDGRPGDPSQWPFKTNPDPADITTEQPATPTEGAPPVSVNMPSEINDLTTLHGFAQAVLDDAEENGPGSTYAAAAASISEYFGRDFGREVNGTASAFEEAAAAYNQAWQAMLEAAEGMKNESLAAIGG